MRVVVDASQRSRAALLVALVLAAAAITACKADVRAHISVADDIDEIEAALAEREAALVERGVYVAYREAPVVQAPPGGDASTTPTEPPPITSQTPDVDPAVDPAVDPVRPTDEPMKDADAEEDAPALGSAGGAEPPADSPTRESVVVHDRAKRNRRAAKTEADRCEARCALVDPTCGLRDRICELAERHAADERYSRACSRAEDQCEAAERECSACAM